MDVGQKAFFPAWISGKGWYRGLGVPPAGSRTLSSFPLPHSKIYPESQKMDRLCNGCGKAYWFKQQWMHDKCVVVHAAKPTGSSRHGKYADPEKRKAYRKEWMRKKRALRPNTPD